jgi:hypothetical protein
MLADKVEVVERVLLGAPRLEFLDAKLVLIGQQFDLLAGGIFARFEGLSAFADGVCGLPSRIVAVAPGQCIHQEVEAAAEGVDDEPDLRVDDWGRLPRA